MSDQKDKQTYSSVDGMGTTESEQIEESFESGGEKPLVVLKPSQSFRQVRFWFFWGTVVLGLWYIFWILIPVLMTGDYASVRLNTSINEKIKGFYLGMVMLLILPYWVMFVIVPLFLKAGTFYFYNDRLELIPFFWGGKTIIIPYKQMYVLYRAKEGGLTITSQRLPSRSHPLQLYKIKYFRGILIGTLPPPPSRKIAGIETSVSSPWENPIDVPKVIPILRGKAFEFKEK